MTNLFGQLSTKSEILLSFWGIKLNYSKLWLKDVNLFNLLPIYCWTIYLIVFPIFLLEVVGYKEQRCNLEIDFDRSSTWTPTKCSKLAGKSTFFCDIWSKETIWKMFLLFDNDARGFTYKLDCKFGFDLSCKVSFKFVCFVHSFNSFAPVREEEGCAPIPTPTPTPTPFVTSRPWRLGDVQYGPNCFLLHVA